MPSTWKFTYWFNQPPFGFSESYYLTATDVKDLVNRSGELLRLRAAALWSLYHTSGGCRFSQVDPTKVNIPQIRHGIYLPPGTQQVPDGPIVQTMTIPARGLLSGSGRTTRPDQVRATANLRVFLPDGRTTTRYFAGVADAFTGTDEEGLDFGGYPAFDDAFTNWRTNLETAGWMVKVRTDLATDPPQDVIGIVQQSAAPNLLGLKVGPDVATASLKDKIQWIHAKQKPRGTLTPNGIYRIDSINTTIDPPNKIYYLRGTGGIDPATIKIEGQIRRVAWTLADIVHIVPVEVGIRKRGSVFPRRVGKSKKYPSVDP